MLMLLLVVVVLLLLIVVISSFPVVSPGGSLQPVLLLMVVSVRALYFEKREKVVAASGEHFIPNANVGGCQVAGGYPTATQLDKRGSPSTGRA